ncbi:MAG: DUF1553 domain-containing protein [Opitutaceae bacterium]|jgi:hypothetical protein
MLRRRPLLRSSIFTSVLLVCTAVGAAPTAPALDGRGADAAVFEAPGEPVPETALDKLVRARLRELKITPAPLCSDAVFLRRAYLDVTGTLPTVAEAREFLDDRQPGKRQRLTNRLLERPEYAAYQAMRWSDLLRVKAEFPINLWPNAAQAYHRWIVQAMRENRPADVFARELLTASGSNFRSGPPNFYRAVQSREPEVLARVVALTFFGMRSELWPTARQAGLAGFFTSIRYKQTGEWKEEIVFFDPVAPADPARLPVFPDGTPAKIAPGQDPREVLADWMLQSKHPWLARSLANRAWGWLLGRGIVNEPDDFRADNPPSNPALLAYLEREFISSRYDMKQLFRLILNSQTYQRSSLPADAGPAAAANFAFYPVRRLEAEVLADALNQITGGTDSYVSAIPEPFTFIPADVRAIALPDGSISGAFLEKFERSSRDTGLAAERDNTISAAQRMHLLNSSHVLRKLEQGGTLRNLLKPGPQEGEPVVNRLYLAVLSRRPTSAEWARAGKPDTPAGRTAIQDLAWALINSPEFLYRH